MGAEGMIFKEENPEQVWTIKGKASVGKTMPNPA